MKRVSEAVTKRLFVVSGNTCAFPKCPLPLVDEFSGKVTGRICHITARRPSGPRYDPNQSDAERNAFENLILMCPIHHDVIDSDEIAYTIERLQTLKVEHENKSPEAAELSDELARALVSLSDVQVQDGSILVAVNQSGGQIAQSITNIQRAEAPKTIVLQPVVRRVSNVPHQEFTTLEIRLKNAGNARPTDARITFRFPESMHRHTTQNGLKHIKNGWVECERDNRFFKDQDLFDHLYPGDTTPYSVFGIHYYLLPDRALESTDEFEIKVRSGDSPPFAARLTFGQLSALPEKTWYVLGPAGENNYSEVVPAE